MSKWSAFAIFFVIILLSCSSPDQGPSTSPEKSKQIYTEHIQSMKGTWKGRIITYSDPRGQVDEMAQPKDFTSKIVIERPTKTEAITSITKTFVNDAPFHQKVKVVEQVKGKQIDTHHGFRSIENGQVTSTLNKLSGIEKKTGYVEKDGHFVWTRSSDDPKALEFFKHINKGNKIRIVGWGYYGNDDLNKAPRIGILETSKDNSCSSKKG